MSLGPLARLPLSTPACASKQHPVQTLKTCVSSTAACLRRKSNTGSSKGWKGGGPGTSRMSNIPGWTSGSSMVLETRRHAEAESSTWSVEGVEM
ncbi:hypothetical protein HYFRA_00006979 [Hymenoscyphus fraxineus]|uniref:Uncharacterized protein n=1 Tax=Hymenoscyphus fraxineus TaxID=746836 RepID=A0A9N9PPB4_9HELO|nr:hypothetical protein HYFRA_00006979 [Hymenoscyphus fraxineus]